MKEVGGRGGGKEGGTAKKELGLLLIFSPSPPPSLLFSLQRFLAQGLAVVSMDIRGSGASYGQNLGPWLEEETDDSLLLLDWIAKQEWSNGRVGLWGISYEGTRALLTGVAGHR